MDNNGQQATVECKKSVYASQDGITPLFEKGNHYKVMVYKTFAVIKDETGCMRNLYDAKSDKFQKEHFKELTNVT